ncbi:MAG: GTP-binding protein [Candidatus Heimdallarchaeota archaeon]|nr:GTP-binding protein [Candidatus Heimdallarchaeota archaeon]MCK4954199.1 GTP-binding protein [Candidatus Heimdallarchaeota archaeon]
MNQLQKIICVGSAFVGKTSLARRFTLNTFIHSYIPTLGVSWLTKTITFTPEQLNENLTKEMYTEPITQRISCWDTGGQEMFTYLRPKYYVGATSAILVFDITNQNSFDDIDMWVSEISSRCPDIPIVLCGNKFDLKDARSVNLDDAIDFAKFKKFDYVETSALDAYNVDKLFYHATRLGKQFSDNHLKFRKEYII